MQGTCVVEVTSGDCLFWWACAAGLLLTCSFVLQRPEGGLCMQEGLCCLSEGLFFLTSRLCILSLFNEFVNVLVANR